MKMNETAIRNTAKQMTIEAIMESLVKNDAVKFADGSFAILQRVTLDNGEEQEVWTEVTVKSKVWKDTKRCKAFDPYDVAKDWEAEKLFKAEEKAKKEAEKARKEKEREKKGD